MITTEECEARIYTDSELMAKALNDNEFIGWLVSSLGPLDNDALELGERVKDHVQVSVEAYAENMAREENDKASDEIDRVVDDPRYGQAADINRELR